MSRQSCFVTVAVLVATASWGQSATARALDTRTIEPQPLAQALDAWARQTGLQLIYGTDILKGRQSAGAPAGLRPRDALAKILEGSGLNVTWLNDRTVAIVSPAPTTSGSAIASTAAQLSETSDNADGNTSQGPSLWDRFRLAQTDQGPTAAVSSTTGSSSASSEGTVQLEEVIVTAEKKSERLQDVPVPLTVLDAEKLAENNQNRLQDYFAQVPGLNLGAGSIGGGTQTLAIRGVTTGIGGNPTVAMTIDDVPFGSSTNLGSGQSLYPDIDPGDLTHVEVLRGPQGTLYGASTIGGLIKLVTADPSAEGLSGRVQLLGNDVRGGEFGYGVRGEINVPLSDTLAVRASGFTRRDPGYIENVTTGQRDNNQSDVSGGLLSALWRPSDVVSLKLSALYQNTAGGGDGQVDVSSALQPVWGDLKEARLPGTGRYSSEAQLYTATLRAKISSLDFVSISGYGVNKYSESIDFSGEFGGTGSTTTSESLHDVAGAAEGIYEETQKYTQEFRLSSAINQTLEWLAGAYYTHEYTRANSPITANNATTGSSGGLIEDFNYPTTLTEYALFGDLTVHFTDRFDVQLGGRTSQNRQVYNETDSGPETPIYYFGAPSPFVNQTERTSGNAFTYLLTPRFKISPDLMAYARFTSGYRLGGPNVNAVVGEVPVQYAPDKTNDYEFGIKADVLDHALTFDVSAYYIAWRSIQLYLLNPTTFSSYEASGGNAKSQGLELSVQARPSRGLTITAVASVNNAELTQNLPKESTAIGSAGDRLPYSSRFSGSLSVNRDIPLTGSLTGFVGGSVSYVGAREGEFPSIYVPGRFYLPSYAETDLRAGTRYASWTVNLFANNVANKRGIVGGSMTSPASSNAVVYYIQPLTTGLSITRLF
jgi:iron complex outermembrane receptor protein